MDGKKLMMKKRKIFEYSKGYMDFLNKAKTEREFVKMQKNLQIKMVLKISWNLIL